MRCRILHALRTSVIFLIIISVTYFTSPAQSLLSGRKPLRQYTMANGLPSNTIRELHKDAKGYLWIATDAGLARFDGRNFRIYSVHDGLPGDKIWSITEDNKGTLWIGSYGHGICSFDGHSFTCIQKSDGLPDDWVRVVLYSPQHELLLTGTEKGLGILREGKFITLPGSPVDPLSIKTITAIYDAGDKIIICSYNSGIYYYYPKQGKIIHKKYRDGYYPRGSSSILVTSTGDTLFSYNRKGIMRVSGDGMDAWNDTTFGQVFSMAENKEGKVWIAAWSHDMYQYGGMYQYQEGKVKDLSNELGIDSKKCWQLLYDAQEDMLWVATLDQGLYLILPALMEHYGPGHFAQNSLDVRTLYKDRKGRMWIGTSTHLFSLSPDRSLFQADGEHLKNLMLQKRKAIGRSEGKPWKTVDERYHLTQAGNFEEIHEDDAGRIWASFDGGGALLYEDGRMQFIHVLDKKTFNFTEGNTMVVGNWNDFGTYNITPSLLPELSPKILPEGRKPSGNIAQILTIGREVWIASWTQGLYRYRDGRIWHYHPDSNGLHHNITSLARGPEGLIIAGDNTGRISMIRQEGEKIRVVKVLDKADGLLGNTIRWLVYDTLGYLWAGNNYGINCIYFRSLDDLREPRLISIDKEEGLQVMSSVCAALDDKGLLWIGGKEGLDVLHTARIYKEKSIGYELKPCLAEIDHRLLPDSIIADFQDSSSPWRLRVPYNSHQFRMGFCRPNYLNPLKDKFRFKLSGYDPEWSAWSENAEVLYGHLPPGSYILLMELRNSSGLEASSIMSISIDVPVPWYLTPLAKLAALILFPGLVVLIYLLARQRTLRIERKRTALQRRMAELEVSALQAQMNPHFIFNSINAIQGYILNEKPEEAISYLADFSRVVRDSLENVSQRQISLAEALDFLESYLRLERMRFPGKFSWRIELGEGVDRFVTMLPPFILQPFAENSIRHGFRHKEGEGVLVVSISALTESGMLEILIDDDGVGLSRANAINARQPAITDRRQNHSSQITAHRIRMMNADGEDRFGVIAWEKSVDGVVSGTSVRIRIPLVQGL